RDSSPELAQALEDLRRLVAERPELAAPGRTLGRVLVAAFGPPGVPTRPPPRAADAVGRLAEIVRLWSSGHPGSRAGFPVVGSDPDPDLGRRSRAICQALRADNPAAAALDRFLRRDPGPWAAAAAGFFAGLPDDLEHVAGRAGVDPGLAAAVMRLALLPVLAPCWVALAPHLPEGGWTGGRCPFCGRPPLLAEARGLEQRRVLRCGLCAASWPADRLRCPACGESDPRVLLHRFVAGQESRHRLVQCEACGSGLKVVSTLGPLSAPGLLVADLATVHLDLIGEAEPPGT
ncbi:MAG TPA: formate dehydrogenase accessory protein FdhE, partial [Isosphaeraceae bacterium]